MKKILIPGINGFIGTHLARFFLEKNVTVCGIDKNIQQDHLLSDAKIVCAEVNVDNLNKMGADFDLIIHCAGSGTVGTSLSDPLQDFNNNVMTVNATLEYMRQNRIAARLVYLSSAAVYGDHSGGAIKETSSLNPVSPYGYNKMIAEHLCQSYSKNFDIDVKIIRFFSIYGTELKKQLLWDACKKIQDGDRIVEFFGTGQEIRDWIHIDDVLSLIFAISKLPDKEYAVFNGGTGEKTLIGQMIELIVKSYGKEIAVNYNNQIHSGNPRCMLADVSKVLEIGWSPKTVLDNNVKSYVQWFKKHYG